MTHSCDTIVDTIWVPTSALGRMLCGALLAAAGAIFIAIAAHIQIPTWPVPVTMQTFAVLLVSLAFGSRLASATVALYLAQGAVGMPVFASGGGLVYFAGPTAGYLYSYLAVALVVGKLGDRGWSRSFTGVAASMLVGSTLIYAVGATWLATFVGAENALLLGVWPFLIGDAVKGALAAALLPTVWTFISRFR